MKKKIIVLSVLLLVMLTLGDPFNNARFKILVLDERTQLPIGDLPVSGCFNSRYPRWENASVSDDFKVRTDVNGMCRLAGRTNCGEAYFNIRCNEGYYDAPCIRVPYIGSKMWGKLLPYQRWQPDNMVVTVLLQRVENPIPLFIRKVESPGFSAREEDGDESGFDLVRGDWLPPYGTGTVADIAFHRSRVVTGVRTNRFRTADWKNPRWVMEETVFDDNTLTINFMGACNGIREFVPVRHCGICVREAPRDGYAHSMTRKSGNSPNSSYGKYYSSADPKSCHVFRIRTRCDETGKIVSCLYGKIYGDFDPAAAGEPIRVARFLYYLNPTPNDRNLEWDRKTNLNTAERYDLEMLQP